MGGAVPPLPQYAFTAWCLVKGSTRTGRSQICMLLVVRKHTLCEYLLRYGLDDRSSIPGRGYCGKFSLLHRLQTDTGEKYWKYLKKNMGRI
jgi:hypothetical protein